MYENYERDTVVSLMNRYSSLLETFKEKKVLKILDIGGASGYFAFALSNYFDEKICEIFVIDPTKYSTWGRGDLLNDNVLSGQKVTFIQDSVENLDKYFSENTFDLIFANRVFHHFVNKTWRKSINSINDSIAQIARMLKNDGRFCITDYFYDGYIFDTSSSKIIYSLTSCKNPMLAFVFRKIDSKSAGIGVCFLSRKMWFKFFNKSNLVVDWLYEEGTKINISVREIIYKIFILIKNRQEDVMIILKKQSCEYE